MTPPYQRIIQKRKAWAKDDEIRGIRAKCIVLKHYTASKNTHITSRDIIHFKMYFYFDLTDGFQIPVSSFSCNNKTANSNLRLDIFAGLTDTWAGYVRPQKITITDAKHLIFVDVLLPPFPIIFQYSVLTHIFCNAHQAPSFLELAHFFHCDSLYVKNRQKTWASPKVSFPSVFDCLHHVY